MFTSHLGEVVSNLTNLKLVALHQYSPSAALVTLVSVRLALNCLISGVSLMMTPVSIFVSNIPFLYQVTLGSGCPAALHVNVTVSPTDRFTTGSNSETNTGITENENIHKLPYFLFPSCICVNSARK